MNSFLDVSSTPLARPVIIAALIALAALVALGIWQPHLARIALRNVPRRPSRTALIIFGLMFATLFSAASLAVEDTVLIAIKSVAVFNLGKIDEDVTTSRGGALHLYPDRIGPQVQGTLATTSTVIGVAPALVVPHVFVADAGSRQVRGNVTIFALAPGGAGPLADLRAPDGTSAAISALGTGEVYLNRNASTLLGAHAGDTVLLTSAYWDNTRRPFRVRATVTGGPLGDAPAVVLPLSELQTLVNAPNQINHVYIANAGDGLTGVGYSGHIARSVNRALPRGLGLHTAQVKADGVRFALNAQDIFGRVLALYTFFALTLGALLVFLIFVLLAAERRVEIGTLRALGQRQRGIVLALLFEGSVYDLGAAVLGIAAGVGISAIIIAIVSPILTQIGFPLQTALQPTSILLALGGGFLFTLVTIGLAALAVSRVTVAAALRDLPEPSLPQPVWQRSALAALPLVLGSVLLSRAAAQFDILVFSVGLSLVVLGVGLGVRVLALFLTRWATDAPRIGRVIDRLTFVGIGGTLALYWSLPFDALVSLGLPRFSGGIDVFFVAGVMMIGGAILALAPNLDIVLLPVRAAVQLVPRARHALRIALVYPVLHRFRTAVSLCMFALAVFTMVLIACIANSITAHYDNLPEQAAGYDIAGRPLTGAVGGSAGVQALLSTAGSAGDVTNVSSATPLLLGMFQPSADNARWRLYPAAQIDGAFLQGVGLPLAARAQGFASDDAVWAAVRDRPGSVVIDTGALDAESAEILGITRPAQPDFAQFIAPPIVANIAGFSTPDVIATSDLQQRFAPVAALAQNDPDDTDLLLSHLAVRPGVITPTTLWVGNLSGAEVRQLTIVGVVDNIRGQRYGLLGSPATFAPVNGDRTTAVGGEYEYFQVRAGVDAHAVARRIGSALFDQSFETTVLQDLLL
nr:hypothetical protein [Ktedonobacterales bacterium]